MAAAAPRRQAPSPTLHVPLLDPQGETARKQTGRCCNANTTSTRIKTMTADCMAQNRVAWPSASSLPPPRPQHL